MDVIGVGICNLDLESEKFLTFPEILYTPNIVCNILSICSLALCDVEVRFKSTQVYVLSELVLLVSFM